MTATPPPASPTLSEPAGPTIAPSRRSVLLGTAAIAAAIGLAKPAQALASSTPAVAPAAAPPAAANGPGLLTTPDQAIATSNGPVRGVVRDGIYSYKGIPYGKAPVGDLRFKAPVVPDAWTTPFDALDYGPICYQGPLLSTKPPVVAYLFNWDYGHHQNEDCLRLNVWTPKPDGKKRPVIVWFHGGGYSTGSSQELPGYEGENVTRRGDVVFVSINHRLNVFGFTNLAAVGGPDYAMSANAGMLDIVLALKWVRDNIRNFGGDPANVTVMGQSGGGHKVITLQEMPTARGLFGRGVSESGGGTVLTPEQGQANATTLFQTLNIAPGDVAALQNVPTEDLWAAWSAAKLPAGPTADGTTVKRAPFADGAGLTYGANIPMIIGANLDELSPSALGTVPEDLTAAGLRAQLNQAYGASAASVLQAAKAEWPNAKPIELLGYIQSVGRFGGTAIDWSTAKSTQPAAVYKYLFSWAGQPLDGRPRAFHTSEIGFVFDNIDRVLNYTGGTPDARQLSATMTDAWVAFARSGNPNHAGMVNWPRTTARRLETIIFDSRVTLQNNPGGGVLTALRS